MKNIKHLFLICIFAVVLFATGCTKDGYVADKLTVGGVDIGSMSREDAISTLRGEMLSAEEYVTVDEHTITAASVGARYNAEASVEHALEESKGVFSGLFKKDIPMQVDMDEALLENVIKALETEVVQTNATVTEEGLTVTNGTSGKRLEREAIAIAIAQQFGSKEKAEITPEYIITAPDKIDYDEFLSRFTSEFKEAEYIRGEDGAITVTEECAGVVLDVKNAKEIMSAHTEEGEVYTIPCTVTLPEKTKADLEAKLFCDILGTYSTNFSSSSANRAHNIGLAASSINDIILMPGEEFSFNDALGERTTERGYRTAGAYVAGKTVDQVGGGICQVSSTLYNTILLSNLEIVERRSHQMTVSYVPMGRDATVNWGTTDFRFKNNTDYPVKVVGEINGRNVAISIRGTQTISDMKVEIITRTESVLPPVEEYVEDDTMPVGETKTEKGSNGYIVSATRVVYSNGAEVSRESLTRSKYNPKKTVVTVGTMVVEVPTQADEYQMPPGLIPPEEMVSDTGI